MITLQYGFNKDKNIYRYYIPDTDTHTHTHTHMHTIPTQIFAVECSTVGWRKAGQISVELYLQCPVTEMMAKYWDWKDLYITVLIQSSPRINWNEAFITEKT